MTQTYRIGGGRLIDRTRPITFSFNGKPYTGYAGDTLASALLANGVRIVGRSFKYARPRGVMTAGVDEPNAILQLGSTPGATTPNVRATEQPLYDGLVARTTNGWPSVNFDLMEWFGRAFGRFMPPGFYYKTFMWPGPLWPLYEKIVRKGAGIGEAPTAPDADAYDRLHQFCDLLVIGGGPAGILAARTAADAGARVLLVDDRAELGGNLLLQPAEINETTAALWLQTQVSELTQRDNVEILSDTTATGWHDHNFVVAYERRRRRLHHNRARVVLLAAGAQERPLVYANNDLPGCMTASAVSTYLRDFGVRPGHKLIVATCNDSAYQAAIDWRESGGEAVVVDARAESPRATELAERGIELHRNAIVIEAAGRQRVRGATLRAQDDERTLKLSCDVLASSGGWTPTVHLSAHCGRKPLWHAPSGAFVPGAAPANAAWAGSINGHADLDSVLRDALANTTELIESLGFEATTAAINVSCAKQGGDALYRVPHPSNHPPPQFVDYQLDVTATGIELANREGFESVEHIKRYTALGFGTDQGKLSNVNGIAIAAEARGITMAEVGTTMFRPNYAPVPFGAVAGREVGRLFDPVRYTAMQPWHESNGALFEDVGQWKRPWYYPRQGETMQETLNRECLAVRNGVGILDASTLGKIDIQGPDAREFLNRVYTNAWKKLPRGQCRYGLMCSEDGMVMDDGVTACLADEHFVMTTTTGGAARVLEWLELWHQTEWPELQVYLNSVTDHWATATLSGPHSRRLLAKLTDMDLDSDAFPFMSWRQGDVAGIPARVFRISFTGELSFEVNVNANYGLKLWEALIEAGTEFDITPYGTETMHILRAEKGFIIVGQDTDGSITPEDLGMGWALARKKPFSFLGKRGMQREDCQRADRKQLVGLFTDDPTTVLPEGSQIVFERSGETPESMVGHVTSSYHSAALGRSIALALIQGGLQRRGVKVWVSVGPEQWQRAEITDTVFYDPQGERQHV
ncbi:MAG: sarcosine oxidase subunit alpha family protein [Pseudomonadota bacterium]